MGAGAGARRRRGGEGRGKEIMFISEMAHLLMVPSRTGSVAGAPGWVWR